MILSHFMNKIHSNEDVLKKDAQKFFGNRYPKINFSVLGWETEKIFEHLQAKNVDCFEVEKGRARIVRQQEGSARGPMALSGELDYKSFSADFFEGYDRSDELDSDTDRVANDAYIGFSSAIWKYMQ